MPLRATWSKARAAPAAVRHLSSERGAEQLATPPPAHRAIWLRSLPLRSRSFRSPRSTDPADMGTPRVDQRVISASRAKQERRLLRQPDGFEGLVATQVDVEPPNPPIEEREQVAAGLRYLGVTRLSASAPATEH